MSNKAYPDQRPGSPLCDEMDERALRLQKLKPAFVDLDAWETKPECWEIPEEEEEQCECASCGRQGHHSEFTEALRRCGDGYGEWYCNDGTGCQKVTCVHCGLDTSRAFVIWVKQEEGPRVPKCRNGWGCRRNNAR